MTAADRSLDSSLQPVAGILRAAVFAGSAVGLAVVAHAVAGGTLPGAGAVLLLTTTCALLWASVARAAEQSLARLTAGVLAVQVALHVAFLGHHPAGAAASWPGRPGGWHALLLHLVAAVALAWWLRRGERALWAWLRRLIHRLTPPVPCPAGCVTRRQRRLVLRRTELGHGADVLRLPARRGPPQAA